jgi:hypothetical protein
MLAAALVVVGVLFARERNRGKLREAELAAAERAVAAAKGEAGGVASGSHVDLPTVVRHVPNHPLRLLQGCSQANLMTIADVLANAIEEGAPQYNGGNFAGCYQTYVGAALELERRMPKTCGGPVRALEDGRTTASGFGHSSEQAWAMRDAFDGLLDVVARSLQGGGGANL